jgi:hypothetical protein
VTPGGFVLTLAGLAIAVLTIKHIVRRKDVLHGGYIEDGED